MMRTPPDPQSHLNGHMAIIIGAPRRSHNRLLPTSLFHSYGWRALPRPV